MRYTTSTMYTTCEDWKQFIRKLQKQLAAEARSRKRRPAAMVLIPALIPVEPSFDGDYG